MSKLKGNASRVLQTKILKENEMEKEKEAPRKLSRKDFVKGAAAVAGAGALASCAPAATPAPGQTAAPAPTCPPAAECPPAEESAPCPTPWIPTTWDEEADVVIAGYGSAGMPAAIEAYDAGAKVLIMEKADWLGGNMRRCGGGIAQAGTIVQKALGVEDNPDLFYEFMLAAGEGLVDPELLRAFANNDMVDWVIEGLGGQPVSEWQICETISNGPGLNVSAFPTALEYLTEYGMEPVLRSHWFTKDPAQEGKFREGFDPPGGTGVFKTVHAALQERGITPMTETYITQLIATPEREVLGVKAVSGTTEMFIKAKRGVILGTGGFWTNQKMARNFWPLEAAREQGQSPPADGEAVESAISIGADNLFVGVGAGGMGTGGQNAGGGLKINTKAQVIDVYGEPIPRLYAAGRTTGGIVGLQYPHCGIWLGSAMWFGRMGGKNAAAEEPWA